MLNAGCCNSNVIYTLIYHSGKGNPTNCFSRHPCTHASGIHTVRESAEAHVFFLTSHAISKAMTLHRVQEATNGDPCLEYVITMVQNGQQNASPLQKKKLTSYP